MMVSSLPTIGFDRYLPKAWLDQALQLAILGQTPDELRKWLAERIDGQSAVKKTSSVLTCLWLRPYPEIEHLHKQAVLLAKSVPAEEWVILHWGMALASYPLFRVTAQVMGRLLRLQGRFQPKAVRSRVLETYGNVGTVPRAVNRIIQSAKDWGAIESLGTHYVPSPAYLTESLDVAEWLLEACLLTDSAKHRDVPDLLRATELFPFDLSQSANIVLRRSPRFSVTREGLDREIVTLVHHQNSVHPIG